MTFIKLLAASTAALALTGIASAQDYSLSPNFGTYDLSAGFMPDPAELEIIAGGNINASSIGCTGMITNAPDARLNWSGGEITIGARSEYDTTLVVNAPDGEWYCVDDVNGLDPELTFNGSGQYDIWVGTFWDEPVAAVLYATEF
jgi:hypothetical protein